MGRLQGTNTLYWQRGASVVGERVSTVAERHLVEKGRSWKIGGGITKISEGNALRSGDAHGIRSRGGMCNINWRRARDASDEAGRKMQLAEGARRLWKGVRHLCQ